MASYSLPNSESVFYADGTTAYSAAAISAAEGSSIAALMAKRERWDYYWANSTARGAEVGMIQGSRGYQADTKTEYLYDNSAWRLSYPYAELTASVSLGSSSTVQQLIGVLSIDAAKSTDTTFVSPSTSGDLTILRAGIYAVSTYTSFGVAATARSFLVVKDTDEIQRVSVAIGEDSGSLAVPNIRITAAGTVLHFLALKDTGVTPTTMTTRVRIGRVA